MSFVKYRVKEVASDFGVAPKEITEIIGKFMEKPKSYSQVLTDAELNVVFDYMTQKNQIKSLEQVFAVKPAAPQQSAAPKTADQVFEERLKQFMTESDSKLSSLRQYSDHRSKSRRR